MQKMIVSCQVCGKTIAVTEKEIISDEDLVEVLENSSCDEDGQETMSNGQPNIVAVRTKT